MRKKNILLVDADGDCKGLVSRALDRIGHQVKHVKTAKEALDRLDEELPRLALVIVDLDPDVHGLVLLDAIAGLSDRPPTVVITSLEESYMKTVSRKHGAARCLGKPLTLRRLQSELWDVVQKGTLTSDRWGNLVPWRGEDKIKFSFRGIAAKLSPTVPKRYNSDRSRGVAKNDSGRRKK